MKLSNEKVIQWENLFLQMQQSSPYIRFDTREHERNNQIVLLICGDGNGRWPVRTSYLICR